MTQLQDVMISLISVIVRYHDSQPGSITKFTPVSRDTEVVAREYSKFCLNIIENKTTAELKIWLEDIIKSIPHLYRDRVHLLNVLLEHALTIHKFNTPKSSEELAPFKFSFTTLLNEICQLLNTSKSKSIKVHSKDTMIDLNGLYSSGWTSGYCRSGQFIIDALKPCINIAGTHDDVHTNAQRMVDEHQMIISYPHLMRQVEDLTKANQDLESQLRDVEERLEGLSRQSPRSSVPSASEILSQVSAEPSPTATNLFTHGLFAGFMNGIGGATSLVNSVPDRSYTFEKL